MLRILASIFTKDLGLQISLLAMSLSGFGIGIMQASKNELGSAPSFQFSGRVWVGLVALLP